MDRLTVDDVKLLLPRGARFVMFEYCISLVIMPFKRPTAIYFLRSDERAIGKSYPFILISLLLGWWGIPWGPIYTITSLVTNLGGGRDVTADVMAALAGPGVGEEVVERPDETPSESG